MKTNDPHASEGASLSAGAPARAHRHAGKRVTIVGAGLAGSLLACYLADAGWRVRMFERRPDPRAKGYQGGRSINLALSVRGLLGLSGAGLDEAVASHEAIRMPGRIIHARDSSTVFQPYSADPADAIHSVSRGGLNLRLIEAAARRPSVELNFSAACVDADLARASATFARGGADAASSHDRVDADLLVGTDGAFSAVRLAMLKTDRFEYSQSYLDAGYKELHIPPRHDGSPAMDVHALHIWPRGGAMMIALPNRDNSFTCTLFWPFRGEHSFESLEGAHAGAPGPAPAATPDASRAAPRATDPAEVRAFFAREYADALPLMPTLEHDFAHNPTSSLVTVRCFPWQRHGRSCLLGDASHAIVPFYGQGMNAAFEDVVTLAASLREHDIPDALLAYEAARKPNADAIADMALDNFIEMRDLAGRPDFQYRKRIEQTLHRVLLRDPDAANLVIPDRVTPQYNLVSFSTAPYWMAQRRGREMARILATIADAIPQGSIDDAEAWTHEVVACGRPLLATLSPIPREAHLTLR